MGNKICFLAVVQVGKLAAVEIDLDEIICLIRGCSVSQMVPITSG